MKIERLRLQNFRGFTTDPEIIFPKDSNVAVFIGVNGAGKSSVLDAIGLLLAQFVINLLGDTARKTERLRRAGFLLTNNDINVKADKLKILFCTKPGSGKSAKSTINLPKRRKTSQSIPKK